MSKFEVNEYVNVLEHLKAVPQTVFLDKIPDCEGIVRINSMTKTEPKADKKNSPYWEQRGGIDATCLISIGKRSTLLSGAILKSCLEDAKIAASKLIEGVVYGHIKDGIFALDRVDEKLQPQQDNAKNNNPFA